MEGLVALFSEPAVWAALAFFVVGNGAVILFAGAAAARVGVNAGTLLGRLMAHEIAHLLLGTDYHGDAGLMRAEWPDDALTHAADEWRFTADEAVRMQRVIAAAL